MKKQLLMLSAAVMVTAATSTAYAETVHTKTYVKSQDMKNVNEINFSAFDVNNDGLYAKSEVGTRLFYVFDRDGNEVIDNLEWDDESVYTITPMKKETYRFVDYDDDGYTDLTSYTYERFYEESGLIRFDENRDGLSASEFIDESFMSLDDNDNRMIDLDEWQEAYMAWLDEPEHLKSGNYNH